MTKRIPDLHVTGFCPDNTEEKHIALLVLLNILNSEDKQSQLVSVCAEEDFCKKCMTLSGNGLLMEKKISVYKST